MDKKQHKTSVKRVLQLFWSQSFFKDQENTGVWVFFCEDKLLVVIPTLIITKILQSMQLLWKD